MNVMTLKAIRRASLATLTTTTARARARNALKAAWTTTAVRGSPAEAHALAEIADYLGETVLTDALP